MGSDLIERERKILSMTTSLEPRKIEEQARLQAPYGKNVNRLNAVYQLYAAISFKPPSRITTPTLVLVSDGDQLVSPRCSEAIANRFNAEIRRHPSGNHDLSTDEPHWIAEQVAQWS